MPFYHNKINEKRGMFFFSFQEMKVTSLSFLPSSFMIFSAFSCQHQTTCFPRTKKHDGFFVLECRHDNSFYCGVFPCQNTVVQEKSGNWDRLGSQDPSSLTRNHRLRKTAPTRSSELSRSAPETRSYNTAFAGRATILHTTRGCRVRSWIMRRI